MDADNYRGVHQHVTLHKSAHHRERRRGEPHVPPQGARHQRRPPGGGERRQSGIWATHARAPLPGGSAHGGAGPDRLPASGKGGAIRGSGRDGNFPGGEAHRFWNAGEEPLRCKGYIEPADNIEYFLGAIYESQKRSGGPRPDPFDAAFLTRRYRSEFSMVEIPAPVQQVVFPVQVAIGTLLGRYKKYADAPEPVRR
jgi:hypothetical protein